MASPVGSGGTSISQIQNLGMHARAGGTVRRLGRHDDPARFASGWTPLARGGGDRPLACGGFDAACWASVLPVMVVGRVGVA